METRSIQADVLIVGGGSAGCMAANRVLELDPTLRVVIFEKGDIKYSGSIARGMDALNIVAIPNFTTPELYVESNTQSCAGVLDAPPSYEMGRRSFDLLKKLEGWGVHFPQDEQGNSRTLAAGDAVTGPRSVIEAMAQGQEAAVSIDRLLSGEMLRWGRTYWDGICITAFRLTHRARLSALRLCSPGCRSRPGVSTRRSKKPWIERRHARRPRGV